MKAAINKKRVISQLRLFFRDKKMVKVMYLFGSTASQKTGPLSDIDVAVLLDSSLSREERFRKSLELASSLSFILGTDKLDFVILNDSPLLLKKNVIQKGVLIGSRDERQRTKMEVETMAAYLDRDYYMNRQAGILLKKIARSGLR